MIKRRNPGQFALLTEYRTDIDQYCDQLIVPYRPAPVIVKKENVIDVTPMKYSMVPSWSKEPKVKFATHNARLESIDQKPTWKTVFTRKHCLVPMTDFIEPIYSGDHAGHMVAFHAPGGNLIYAAGVWDEWVNKETGEVMPTFAIITYEPPPYVAGVGHDRCPVFLDEKSGREWLANMGAPAAELKEFLLSARQAPELTCENHRPMKPGWEKRK